MKIGNEKANNYPPYVIAVENWDGNQLYMVLCPKCKMVNYTGYTLIIPKGGCIYCGCNMGLERKYLEFMSNFNRDKLNNRRRISNRTQGVSNG